MSAHSPPEVAPLRARARAVFALPRAHAGLDGPRSADRAEFDERRRGDRVVWLLFELVRDADDASASEAKPARRKRAAIRPTAGERATP